MDNKPYFPIAYTRLFRCIKIGIFITGFFLLTSYALTPG